MALADFETATAEDFWEVGALGGTVHAPGAPRVVGSVLAARGGPREGEWDASVAPLPAGDDRAGSRRLSRGPGIAPR